MSETDRAQQVLGAVRDLLGDDDVDHADNFFEVGGDSLLAVQLVGKLREAGIEASVGDVFAAATIRDITREQRTAAMTPVGDGNGTPADVFTTAEALGVVRELLGTADIEGTDNFFEVGGDSLLAVQLVGKLREAGIDASVGEVFAAASIADIATGPGSKEKPPSDGDADPLTDGALLLPAQQRWLEYPVADINYWNLVELLDCPLSLSLAQVQQIHELLRARHSALRTAYRYGVNGWVPVVLPVSQVEPSAADVVTLAESDLPLATIQNLQASLDLASGLVFKLVLLNRASASHLLVLVHHLTADGVSMAVICDEIETAAKQLTAGSEPALPAAPPAPVQRARAMLEWCSTAEAASVLREWVELPWDAAMAITRTAGAGAPLSAWKSASCVVENATVSRIMRGLKVDAQACFLSAVAAALGSLFGPRPQLVDMYAHSRADTYGGLEALRTVGYIQSTFPMILGTDEGSSPASIIQTIAAQMRAIPQPPSSFDALRFYGNDDASEALRGIPRPRVRCNFRGGMSRVLGRPGALMPESEDDTGPNRSRAQTERYSLLFEGDMVDGSLQILLKYSPTEFSEEEISRMLAEAAGLDLPAGTGTDTL